jgi:RNA polymerase sigma-70 factor, ECF subfamily
MRLDGDQKATPDRPAAGEAELLALARNGDARAFEQALLPHLPMLFAYSRAICGDFHAAQDVVQETSLVAFRNLHHLFPEVDFVIWLKAIARRQSLAARRKLYRFPTVAEELLEKVYEEPSLVAEGPRQEALQECLKLLAGRMTEVVRGHYFQGRKLAELAGLLNLSEGAVKQMLYRSRLRLLECVNKRLRGESLS